MGQQSVGTRASALPWLCPAGSALLALTDERPPPRLLDDPAVQLLVLRYARPTPTPDDCRNPALLLQPIVADAAAAHLERTPSSIDLPPDLLRAARRASQYADRVAVRSGLCPPAAAAAAGLLAPLGRMAVAAVGGQSDLMDAAIVRRLAARWRLPHWLASCIGLLSHGVEDAAALGADRGLVAVVRAAVAATERDGFALGILAPSDPADVRDLVSLVSPDEVADDAAADGPDPRENPLLPRLLRAAARARRVSGRAAAAAEAEADRLHALLADVRASFDVAVRDAKLDGLAELAAGAGHEINNPLAIVSGNAQILLAREADPDRRKALDTIARQARRIADILRDLRQFARPTPPVVSVGPVAAAVTGAAADCELTARAAGVVIAVEPGECPDVLADPRQLRAAVAHLVRNAVEASPPGGAVRVATMADGEWVAVTVEDAGPGPAPAAVPHLFDPFFSGREAGRGRGLGLPTAWRFATQNGGDVRFTRPPGGPTRFVLTVPAARAQVAAARASA